MQRRPRASQPAPFGTSGQRKRAHQTIGDRPQEANMSWIMHGRSRTTDNQNARRLAVLQQDERSDCINPCRLDQTAMRQQSMTIQRTDRRPRTVTAARRCLVRHRLQQRRHLGLRIELSHSGDRPQRATSARSSPCQRHAIELPMPGKLLSQEATRGGQTVRLRDSRVQIQNRRRRCREIVGHVFNVPVQFGSNEFFLVAIQFDGHVENVPHVWRGQRRHDLTPR